MENWLDKSEYPFKSEYFEVNGHRLHYIEEGSGDILLFVHGTPSWSFEFRNIIKGLCDNYRCIALDHIGFGLSDKPEKYDYSTMNHSQTLEKFVLEKNLQNINLVVHDFGGPIGLSFAIRHPERIAKIIILNSWLWSSASDPDFKRLQKVLRSPLLPFLYRYLNFSARFILPRSFGDRKINPKILSQYTRPFANSKQRNGTLAFARSLLHDQYWFESLWSERESIANKPVLLIWGMKDPVLKPHLLKKFQENFTDATTIALETSGHFPHEEQPAVVFDGMKKWLQARSI